MVEIEIVYTETIKPSSPTPHGLKRFSLSVFDQFVPDMSTPVVFFYPDGGEHNFSDRIDRLKLSLAEALVRFYPLAGRLVKEERYVDCDDGGVDFMEAKVKGCRLSDILGQPDDNVVRELLPAQSEAEFLMRVQANVLECGGLAVAVRFRHAIMDACAMSAFLKGWAAVARGDTDAPGPDLDAIASRFPPIPVNLPLIFPPEVAGCSMRRLVFQAPKIAALREKSTIPNEERPTRVATVSAFISKCIVNALTRKSGDEKTSTRPLIICQPMNLRTRFNPPLSENSLGNMVAPLFIESGGQNNVQSLANQLRRGLINMTQNYVPKLLDSGAAMMALCELGKKYPGVSAGDEDFYAFTSWCKYGWYEVDFGWGRPAWMSTVNPNMKNVVMMVDTKDGDGIEVFVILSEEDMTSFEIDPELLEFASLNPSVGA